MMLRKGRGVACYAECPPRVEGKRGLLEASQSLISPPLDSDHLAELYYNRQASARGVCRLARQLPFQTPK